MLRKLFAVALLALFVVPFVAGAQEPINLTFSHFFTDNTSGPGKVVQTQLDKFLADHPNVTVTSEVVAHDEYYTKFRVLASSNELPDIFIMNADITTPASNAGLLMDLTDVLNADPDWLNLQNPGGMFEWTRNGRIYGLPAQMIITHVIYYNKNLLSQVGYDSFPTDWETLMQMITDLRAAGITPIALGAKAGWPLFDCFMGTLTFRATGLDWYNRLLAHEAAFTDPEFLLALNTFKSLVDIGALNADATSLDAAQANSLYNNGEAAMVIQGNWQIPGITNEALPEVEAATGMAMWPPIPGGLGEPNEVTWAAGWGWSLSSRLQGEAREAALDLLKLLSNEDYGRMRIESGNLAAQPITDFDTSNLPRMFVELNINSLEWKAVPILSLGFPPSTTDIFSQGLQEIITGQSTPEQVAAKMQADYAQYAP